MGKQKHFIVFILAMSFSTGCSIGNYGTLVGRYTYTPTAVVVDVYSLGGHVRTDPIDKGFSFGVRNATYLFPKPEGEIRSGEQKWSLFNFSLPKGEVGAVKRANLGIEAQTLDLFNKFNIGYSDNFIVVGPGFGDSRIVHLDYIPNDPGKTCVLILKKEKEYEKTCSGTP